jgi:hypothetical protein
MRQHWGPWERQPVSVHAPFLLYPSIQYRHEDAEERRAALQGMPLGAYEHRLLHRLVSWNVPVVATVVLLLRRARHAATRQAHRGGGEPR